MMDQIAASKGDDPAFRSLYKMSGVAALIAAILFRRNLDAEFLLLRNIGIIKFGPSALPNTVLDWFSLLQNNKLLGLSLLNFFDVVNYALVGVIFLALCMALRRASPALMALAAGLSIAGITIYFSTNQALSMLSLSNHFAAAITDQQRTQLLATGNSLLVIHRQNNYSGGGIYPSFLLVSMAGLIIALVMLRGTRFSKGTAYMGILANGFGLAYYVVLVIAPALVFIPISISAVFLLAWYTMIGLRLL
jgi:hypothetical protein